MAGDSEKVEKKRIKAQAKAAKALAKAGADTAEWSGRLPEGVGVTIRRREEGADLVVTGLDERQLRRIVPQVSKEVFIAVEERRGSLRAGLMKFVREGVVPTIVKIVAGLIVGLLLFYFGFR